MPTPSCPAGHRIGCWAEPFARLVIAHDLPALPVDRVEQTLAFVRRRLDGLPSPAALGVGLVAAAVRAVAAVPVIGSIVVRRLVDRSWPAVGEYTRLLRSLSLAYVFETWPETGADGAPHARAAAG